MVWRDHRLTAAVAVGLGISLGIIIGQTGTIKSDVKPPLIVTRTYSETGLKEVTDEENRLKEPLVDIIAVHGIGSSYPSTWTKDGVMFLKDFLPKDFPEARVMAFVYPSEPFGNPVFVDLPALGARLLRSILDDRTTSVKRNRPIIFIGHSFGGLVIKQALILADSRNDYIPGTHSHIVEATRGILFLGTPHFGSRYATFGIIRAWFSSLFGGGHTGLLTTLQTMSNELKHLNRNFLILPAIRKIPEDIVCFFELRGEVQALGCVVDEDSACLGASFRIGLDTTHKGLNKFSDPGGEYRHIRSCIERVYAPLLNRSLLGDHDNAQYVFLCAFSGAGFVVCDHDECCIRRTDTEWILYQDHSGWAGSFIFKHEKISSRVAVTIGVHNWVSWVQISSDVEIQETAEDVTKSFWADGSKRNSRHPVYGKIPKADEKQIFPSIFVTASLTDIENEKGRFRVDVVFSVKDIEVALA